MQLPLPPQRLSEHYITQVHKHVLSDDEVIGTFDGIGCLSIYSKFLFDIGKPRKAWLAHRRATTFAQLLNLHCKKSRAVDSPDCSSSRKDFVWFDLYFIDQVMALQLGQPYTISRQQFDLNDEEIRALPLDISLMLREAGMCARIVDRNWELPLKPLNTCLSRTSEIDADLDELEKVIPTEWLSEPDHREINVATTHVMFHFIHHQVRMYVHLPLMLRSATEKRFNHNRLAALQASRDMLKSYAVLRETCSMGSYICKAVDFQSVSTFLTPPSILPASRRSLRERNDFSNTSCLVRRNYDPGP